MSRTSISLIIRMLPRGIDLYLFSGRFVAAWSSVYSMHYKVEQAFVESSASRLKIQDSDFMQKVQKGFLESKIDETYKQLLAAIDGVDIKLITRPNTIARDYSVLDILNYLAGWGEMVNKGLRDIQRRKKPTGLQRAMEDQKAFRKQMVEEAQDDELADALFRIEDVMYAYEDQLRQLSFDDLNRPKRLRFIGNKPLWPFIAKHTYQHDAEWVDEIESFLKRAK